MGMPSIYSRPSLYNMPVPASVPAPVLPNANVSSVTTPQNAPNCSHQTACSCPQPLGQAASRPQTALPPTVYVLPIFMNTAATPVGTTASAEKPALKEKTLAPETSKTEAKASAEGKTSEAKTSNETTKPDEAIKSDETTEKKDETKKTESKTDGKVSEEERVGKQVGEFITKLLIKYPELMDKLKDFLEDPGPTVNRIHRAFHRSRILRLFLKIPDRVLLWPFDEETRPIMRKVLKFLKSTPKWDDFDFDFDKEFPDFAFN